MPKNTTPSAGDQEGLACAAFEKRPACFKTGWSFFWMSAGAYPLPRVGIGAPTTARVGTCRLMVFSPVSVPEGFQRASGKPFGAPAGAYSCPGWGLVRRLWCELGLAVPWVSRQLWCPKVSKGRAESPLVRPQAQSPFPGWGLTRRLRRELGLAVPWGVHTFLSVAKEKCAKESQRHGDSGKKPFTAHF